ncbi:MAG: SAM-dependent methyltransferase [Nannocystaceae bacterium]|nr:SAM-dependent methyltransferase [Nannocystaceae bacterium]
MPGENLHEPQDWPDDAVSDRLIGDWHVWQRRGGHRTGTDDVLTAWFAAWRFGSVPARYLDLGCGIGSVLLMTAHRLRPTLCTGVEAQPQSVRMARRAVAELPSGAPVFTIIHRDFREFVRGKDDPACDLITGSPPYFPVSSGVLPADPQRRACRFEIRGGIEGYCETAARWLTPTGRFYFVFQTTWNQRVLDAVAAAGLHLYARVDAKMREGRPDPFLTVYEVGLRASAAPVASFEVTIRTADGEITEEYMAARRELGVQAG